MDRTDSEQPVDSKQPRPTRLLVAKYVQLMRRGRFSNSSSSPPPRIGDDDQASFGMSFR
jgi:hypothetical protein